MATVRDYTIADDVTVRDYQYKTGTPGGGGFRRDSQISLRLGDRVVGEIEGLGRLENPVAAEVDRFEP
jgi:2-keto-4-pentenoate hydratase/2-oxohepta-3-ene-1,7-dioic acid hydratase in catechol pathway